MRALVVDDNPINLKIVQFNLKQLNIESDSATNGLEAVNCFKENFYPLIFMDIHMPVMDGYLAAEEIRKYEKEKAIAPSSYIVALTADTLDETDSKYVQSGINTFIPKPINQDDLKKIISQLKINV